MNNLTPIKLPPSSRDSFFSGLDPFDARYYDPQIAKYLSEEARIAYQAYIEATLAQTLADFNICSFEVARQIEVASRRVTAREVQQKERVTKHDIKALVEVIKSKVDAKSKPYVHFGATSYDIVASASSLQMRNAIDNIIIPRLVSLENTLIALADKHSNTRQIGRTHGQHALPMTFGFALAEYVSRIGESILAVQTLATELKGKFSGAVGAYNSLSLFVKDPIKFEKALLQKVGLEPAPYSTQIVPPESMIRLIDELTILAGIMANLAHDMRHLQRSEIAEVHERFEKSQTGSSTMAHKRNPWNFENIISMSKQVLAQSMNANLNIASEHQRDLTDSASSRFYPLAIAGVAVMAKRLEAVMSKLEVDETNMRHNLKASKGAIAAEPLYLLLAKYGHPKAHEKAKELAHKALDTKSSLFNIAQKDVGLKRFLDKLTASEKAVLINPEKHYTGLANKKTKIIASYWTSKIKTIPTP